MEEKKCDNNNMKIRSLYDRKIISNASLQPIIIIFIKIDKDLTSQGKLSNVN